MKITSVLAAVAFAALTQAAVAQAPTSQFTSAKEKDCRTAEKSGRKEQMPWVVQACKGVGGFVLRIFDVDERQTVSIGKTVKSAAKEPAAKESFGPFNHVDDKVEWRLRDGKPFAAIVRWLIADNENTGTDGNPKNTAVLVVMRLSPACRLAFVDAAANPDADVLARAAADEKATAFTCGKDEAAVVGKPGRGTELAKPQ